ncbi:uncharacterized protein PG998_005906 [Apiospora kogelbergensis]|uniref:Uncharacterized protein n=1 Tax=Apiospora kogelbergensis TaxID=1337665 RepID=A0AAW0R3Q6_9PEZI
MLLIESFTRVIHQIDTAEHITALFSSLESQTLSPSELSPRDRRSVLDFPEEAELRASVRQSTALPSRAALVQRAAHAPADLTTSELEVLRHRYWPPDRRPGLSAKRPYHDKVAAAALSLDDEQVMYGRLAAVRVPALFELGPDEKAALENVHQEWGRRWRAEREAELAVQVEKDLSRLDARWPWIRRIWEDTKAADGSGVGDCRWGFVQYRDPDGGDGKDQWEEYECAKDGRLMWARISMGFPTWFDQLCGSQLLPWPEDIESPSPHDDDDGHHQEEEAGNSNSIVKRETLFQKLRDNFLSLRDGSLPTSEAAADGRKSGGLQKGLLTNVFLVHDHATVHSVLGMNGLADEMWVWAVDPDYKPLPPSLSSPLPPSLLNPEYDDDYPTEEYRGYFRVRIQQLVKNFYLARRYRSDEFSMADLWGMAQKSRNQTFVSLNESEFQRFSVDRSTGSALRYEDAVSAQLKPRSEF